MSSPLVTKSITSNIRMDGEDPYSTAYVENLLGGLNEWRNIQDIVRTTIKALCEVVRSQGVSIRELEKQIVTKASKSELNSGLNIKANVADVMRTFSEVASSIESRPTMEEIHSFLDEKVSKNDLQYFLNSKPSYDEVRNLLEGKVNQAEFNSELSSVNLKIDDLQKDFIKKSANYATAKDIQLLNQAIESKANFNEVNEALNTKASKESVINALHRKANKNEIDTVLKSKVDIEELQNIINNLNNKADVNDLEKIYGILDSKAEKSEISNLNNLIGSKAEIKDFDLLNTCYLEIKRDFSKRIDDLDQDIDRLIENIKKEFGNLNIVINNLDMKKVDFKEFEKLNTQVSKKTDNEILNSSLGQMKNDIYESFGHFRSEIQQSKKLFEDNCNEKLSLLEKNLEKSLEEYNRNKERINDFIEKRKMDQDENLKTSKNMINNLHKDLLVEINLIRAEIQKNINDIQDLFARKQDKRDFDGLKSKIFETLDQKLEINFFDNFCKNIHKELSDKSEETRVEINQILQKFENEVFRNLDKKANISDVTSLINTKADLGSTQNSLQNKVNIQEFESLKLMVDRINKETANKIDFNKFDAYMSDSRSVIEELQKELALKANLKDTLALLNKKADIEKVNDALIQVTEDLDLKCSIQQFNAAMDNQAIINDALCSENCVARWTWKSGQVKNGYAIPWEIQTVNTAPDNFIWEKEKTSILIASSGLYEISMGIYADKKPTVQILVNGEPVISAVNSSNYVIHHNGNKMKNMGKHSSGNITGLTLIDYVCLPERARISVSYSGDEGGEGFMGIRKI